MASPGNTGTAFKSAWCSRDSTPGAVTNVRSASDSTSPTSKPVSSPAARGNTSEIPAAARWVMTYKACIGNRHSKTCGCYQYIEVPAGGEQRAPGYAIAAAFWQPINVHEDVHEHAADKEQPAWSYSQRTHWATLPCSSAVRFFVPPIERSTQYVSALTQKPIR